MSIEIVEKNNKLVFEPLEPGNGHTLGVLLRRTLLNQLSGAAPIAVRIKDIDEYVKHEFTTIKGVRETVLHILLNIKKMRVELLGNEPKIIKARSSGGVLKAKDFEVPNEVKIINKDLEIANIDAAADVTIEVIVAKGKGYMLAETVKNKYSKDIKEFLGIEPKLNIIFLDALFSPIVRVNYKVNEVSHPIKGKYDSLELEVESDGSITATEAIKEAAVIVAKILSNIAPDRITVLDVYEEPQAPIIINKSIEELGLDEEIQDILKTEGITTLSQLKERLNSGALKAFLKEKHIQKIKKIIQ
ncbi:MAG: hypothetical protein NZ870_00080 [bacterium]|nr:hypothetical protein [bacterium]